MLVLQPVVAHTVNPSLFRKRTNAHGHDFPQLKGRLWLEGGGLCFKTTRDMFACTWRMRLSVGCGQQCSLFRHKVRQATGESAHRRKVLRCCCTASDDRCLQAGQSAGYRRSLRISLAHLQAVVFVGIVLERKHCLGQLAHMRKPKSYVRLAARSDLDCCCIYLTA